MSGFDSSTVAKVASLARLALDAPELDRMASQLASIVEFVSALGSLDTSAVEPLAHPQDSVNVFRDDRPGECLPRDRVLATAPKHDEECFLVPAVLGEDH